MLMPGGARGVRRTTSPSERAGASLIKGAGAAGAAGRFESRDPAAPLILLGAALEEARPASVGTGGTNAIERARSLPAAADESRRRGAAESAAPSVPTSPPTERWPAPESAS